MRIVLKRVGELLARFDNCKAKLKVFEGGVVEFPRAGGIAIPQENHTVVIDESSSGCGFTAEVCHDPCHHYSVHS